MANKKSDADLQRDVAQFLARILIASYFLARSAGLIIDPDRITHLFLVNGFPQEIVLAYTVVEIIAAGCVLIGHQTLLATLSLVLLVVWFSFLAVTSDGDIALNALWQDYAMIGGLLLLFGIRQGRFTVGGMRRLRIPNSHLDNHIQNSEHAIAGARDFSGGDANAPIHEGISK